MKSKQTISYIKATKAWIKTHSLVIQSSDDNIAFYKKQVSNFKKMIAAELIEKKTKIELNNEVMKNLQDAEKGN
jgi:hypothetical protein